MTSKKEVAYKALSTSIPEISAPPKIAEPNYPDKGVSFAGYSKSLISGSQYRLNPQQQIDYNLYQSFLAGSFGFSISRVDIDKDFYCTSIAITSTKAAVVFGNDLFQIEDGSDIKFRMLEIGIDSLRNGNSFVMNFNIPVKFTKNNLITFRYSAVRALGDTITINLFGWIE